MFWLLSTLHVCPLNVLLAGARGAIILDKIIFYSLLGLLVITLLPYGTVEVWSTAIWELLVLALTLLWGIHSVINKRLEIVANPLVWPMLGLLAVAAIQLIPFSSGPRRTITYDSFATFDAGVKLFVMILFFLLFSTFVNSDERRRKIVTVVIIMAAAIALIGIGQSYLTKLIWPKGSFGPFVNRNHFAGFLEMAAGLTGARILSRTIKREKLMLYICFLILICTGIILSASRGGFLALGGVVVFLGLSSIPTRAEKSGREGAGKSVQLRFVAALILLVVMAGGAMLLTQSDELMQRFGNYQAEIKSAELADERFSRKELWEVTTRMIKDHPLLGVGVGAYQYAYPRYDQSSGILRAEQAHNDYLQIVVDAGVVGGILALAYLIILFARGFSFTQTRNQIHRGVVLGALAGCFGIAVHSFVDFNLQVTANAQLFVALAALATTKQSEEEKSRAANELSVYAEYAR